jgi:chitinase
MDSSVSTGAIYQINKNQARGGGYSYLKDSVVNQNGYKRYWDRRAKAPYLFNEEEESIYYLMMMKNR